MECGVWSVDECSCAVQRENGGQLGGYPDEALQTMQPYPGCHVQWLGSINSRYIIYVG